MLDGGESSSRSTVGSRGGADLVWPEGLKDWSSVQPCRFTSADMHANTCAMAPLCGGAGGGDGGGAGGGAGGGGGGADVVLPRSPPLPPMPSFNRRTPRPCNALNVHARRHAPDVHTHRLVLALSTQARPPSTLDKSLVAIQAALALSKPRRPSRSGRILRARDQHRSPPMSWFPGARNHAAIAWPVCPAVA